jgi:hypothetical protein
MVQAALYGGTGAFVLPVRGKKRGENAQGWQEDGEFFIGFLSLH